MNKLRDDPTASWLASIDRNYLRITLRAGYADKTNFSRKWLQIWKQAVQVSGTLLPTRAEPEQ
jgi:hypothetical protein